MSKTVKSIFKLVVALIFISALSLAVFFACTKTEGSGKDAEADEIVVTYVANGGELEVETATLKNGDAYGALPVPTRDGYIFDGWYTALADGLKIEETTIVTSKEDHALYAMWVVKGYSIMFDKQSGIGGTSAISSNYETQLPKISVPTRMGYTFGGYFTETNGSGTKYYNADGTGARGWDKTTETILYAQWIVNTYTIQFNSNKPGVANGTISGDMADQTFAYGASQNLTSNKYSLTGCTFAGWNTKADGSGTSYSDKQSIKNLTTINGETLTLYAQWTVKFTVNLNVSGLKDQHDIDVAISTGDYHSGWMTSGVTNLTPEKTLDHSGTTATSKNFNKSYGIKTDTNDSDLLRGKGYHIVITLTNAAAGAFKQGWFTVEWASTADLNGNAAVEPGRDGYNDIRESSNNKDVNDWHSGQAKGYATVTYGNTGDDKVVITIFGLMECSQTINIKAYGGEYDGAIDAA